MQINSEFEYYYQPYPKQKINDTEEHVIPMEELGIVYYEDHYIDLKQAVIDTIMTELPAKLLCDDDCQGLCYKCGQNLNNEACKCNLRQDNDNPFKELLNNK